MNQDARRGRASRGVAISTCIPDKTSRTSTFDLTSSCARPGRAEYVVAGVGSSSRDIDTKLAKYRSKNMALVVDMLDAQAHLPAGSTAMTANIKLPRKLSEERKPPPPRQPRHADVFENLDRRADTRSPPATSGASVSSNRPETRGLPS
jgi:hypothetical protein